MAHASEVAPSVHRLGSSWVNWYLIDDGGGVTVVDSGFAGYYEQLPATLSAIGRSLGDIVAVVLTHYHPDHVGSAERIRRESGAVVYAPEAEAAGIRGEEKVPRPRGIAENLWRPRMLRYLAHALANGGARAMPVAEVRTYDGDDVLDVPGRLRAICTPGHSRGHCSLLDEGRGIVFAGDALGTVSFASDRLGPQPPMVNEDRAQAIESMSRLAGLSAGLLLCGHGEPHHGPMRDAIAQALGTD